MRFRLPAAQQLSKSLLSAFLLAGLSHAAPSCESQARLWREGKESVRQQEFQSCISTMDKGQASALATLALAVGEIETKQWDAALRHLGEAGPQLPTLKDYVGWFHAQAHDGKAEFGEALAALEPVWSTNPESPILARALPMAVRLAMDSQQPERAVSLLRKYPTQLGQPMADIFLAAALDAAGQSADAAPVWERVHFLQPVGPYPQNWDSAKVTAAWQAHGANVTRPAQWLTRASRLLPSRPGQAKAELLAVSGQLTGAQSERAGFLMAMAEFYAKNYAAAIPALQSAKSSTPEEDAERLHSLYQAGRRSNREEVSQSALAQLAEKYPSSPWRLEVMLTESYRYLNENDYARYEPIYEDCATNFVKDPKGAFCHWRLTWSNYLRRRTGAVALLQKHLENYPASEKGNAALYFLSQQTENLAEAKAYLELIPQRFPNTYYQMLAEEKLADAKFAGVVAQQPAWLRKVKFADAPEVSRGSVPHEDYRIGRARLLKAASLDSFAEQELRFAARGQKLPFRLATELANLMYSAGSHERGLRAIKGLLPGYLLFPKSGFGPEFWKLAFPLPYRNYLQRYSTDYDLDPFIVAGLIRQESEFNPKVVSRAKAYGLTQILPSTGYDLARRVKLSGFNPSQLFVPEINLKLGTYYLRNLMASLNGSWVETLAAYNAGRSRVIKWRTFADYREPAEFIETIPFGETRDYVQSVLRNGAVYRQLYSGEPLTLASDNGGSSQPPPKAVAPSEPRPSPKKKITSRVSPRPKTKAATKPKNRRIH